MCGLFGFHSITNSETKFKLAAALGVGIDTRGYAARGFVASSAGSEVLFLREKGSWRNSSDEFIMSAASGDMCMAHSRAPGQYSPVTDAHPFPITRDGKVVLWGSHNGALDQAWESARKHGREITVDSMELFELIADREVNTLQKLRGWGVATWVEASAPHQIKISRLSRHSELVAVEVTAGGTVYASTWDILGLGLEYAGLEVKQEYDLSGVGQVFLVDENGVTRSTETGVCCDDYLC